MKYLPLIAFFLLNITYAHAQEFTLNQQAVKEDLQQMIANIKAYYVYLPDKNVDLECIRNYYEKQIPKISSEEEKVLFFEYLLDEFYDSHVILNTNRNSSFRLFAPVYASLKNGKAIISQVWQTQLTNLNQNILAAQITKINGLDLNTAIEQFPTQCTPKNAPASREWIINKLLAGRYNQPRVLSLVLSNKKTIELDLDELQIKQEQHLLSSQKRNNIGIIRIHNSLGNDELVPAFDQTLDSLMDTKGLIIDLRNTKDGGNSYVARGIMGRFISEPRPYQKHLFPEKSYAHPTAYPKIERSWVEYVSPRGSLYKQPVVVLVGRWTGSMGEGLAIGFEGIKRATVVGTEMERLAGEIGSFSFKYQNFGYRLATARLFHVNGTPREVYVPKEYVRQTTLEKDEVLEKGMQMIRKIKK